MTKEERANIKVGLTVLVGIFVLLFGIAWAKGWAVGSSQKTVRAVFATAGGLEAGDPVMVNGVKEGRVESVTLRPSDVIVSMSFPEHVDLREDARASITMLELMGGKKVELLAGSSPKKLPDNAIISGYYTGDIGSVVALIGSVSTTVQSIAVKADTLFTSLNGFFQGNTMQADVRSTLASAGKTLTDIDRLTGSLQQTLRENAPALVRTIEQADAATKNLNGMLEENRTGVRKFLDSTGFAVAEARGSLARASLLFSRIDSMWVSGSRDNSLLHKLMRDQGFAGRIDSILTSLGKLSEQIRLQGIDANVRFFNSSKPDK